MRRPSRTRALSLALLAAAALVVGCRGKNTLRQRCLAGDGASCDAACSKGVTGEGGCFHAAEEHRRRAGGDHSGTEGRRAAELYEKACAGGYADGCLFAAQGIEAPFTGHDAKPGELPPMIPDKALELREEKLARACALGSSAGCQRFGDATIGKNAERANGAYEKACRASADARGCEAAREREVALAEKLRTECTHHVADSCSVLGDLLYSVDPPRATRLFVAECELRGVAELEGGLPAFVVRRELEARRGIPLSDEHAATAPPESAPKVSARSEIVRGRVAIVEVDRALSQHLDAFAVCAAKVPKSPAMVVDAELVVDLTGDVYRATVPDGAVGQDVAGCLATVLEGMAFSPPANGLPEIRVSLTFGEAPVPSKQMPPSK